MKLQELNDDQCQELLGSLGERIEFQSKEEMRGGSHSMIGWAAPPDPEGVAIKGRRGNVSFHLFIWGTGEVAALRNELPAPINLRVLIPRLRTYEVAGFIF